MQMLSKLILMLRKLLKSKQRKDKIWKMTKRWVKWWLAVPLTAVWLRSLEVCLLLFTCQLVSASKERIRKEPSDDFLFQSSLGCQALDKWSSSIIYVSLAAQSIWSWKGNLALSGLLSLPPTWLHFSASTLGYKIPSSAYNRGIRALCLTSGSSDGKSWKSSWCVRCVDRFVSRKGGTQMCRWGALGRWDVVSAVFVKTDLAHEEWIRLRMKQGISVKAAAPGEQGRAFSHFRAFTLFPLLGI